MASLVNRKDGWQYIPIPNGARTAYSNAVGTTSPANRELQVGELGAFTDIDLSVRDPVIYNRALSLAEIQQLADPSNVMLSGLIQTKRKWWPTAPATGFTGSSKILGGGVLA